MQEKPLSRREREVMDILFTLGEATAKDVHARLTGGPSYSTVRAMLARLETKGYVKHQERGMRYVYTPMTSRTSARRSEVERLVKVFFEGSLAKAVTGLVDESGRELTGDELDAIEAAIAAARRKANTRDPE